MIRVRFKWWQFVLCSCAFVLLGHRQSHANRAKDCRQLYQKSRYVGAGHCYMAQARKLAASQRHLKGRMMRNAALSYARAARQMSRKRAVKRAYLYELAAKIMHKYIKGRMAENDYRLQSGKRLRQKFFQEVGYGALSVQTEERSALIEVRGYRFRAKRKHKLTRWLRPGRYRVRIVYFGPRATLNRNISIKRFQKQRIVIVRPPAPMRIVPTQPRPRPKVRQPMRDFDPDEDHPIRPNKPRPTRPPFRRPPPFATPKRRTPPTRTQRRPPQVRSFEGSTRAPSVDELLNGFDTPQGNDTPPKRTTRRPKLKAKSPTNTRRIVLLSIASIGGIAVGLGITLMVMSNDPYQEARRSHQKLLPNVANAKPAETKGIAMKVREAQLLQGAGIATMITGGVVGLATLIWAFATPKQQPEQPKTWEIPE